MPLNRLSIPTLLTAALSAVIATVPRAATAQVLTQPLAPMGSARNIGMGSAVVALTPDAGAVVVNPAAISNVGVLGNSDITLGGGAVGLEAFGIHTYGQSRNMIPGAVWGGALTAQGVQQQFLAYTVSSSDPNGIDVGTTLRYDRWQSNGSTAYTPDVDLGVRYRNESGVSIGGSALNLLRPHPFRDQTYAILQESEIIGGVGYSKPHGPKVEGDYVYTQTRQYGRFGAELPVGTSAALRAGLSDRDISLGGSLKATGRDLSLAVVFPSHQKTLYYAGFSARF